MKKRTIIIKNPILKKAVIAMDTAYNGLMSVCPASLVSEGKYLISEGADKARRAEQTILRAAYEIREDIDAICQRDPAARSRIEELTLYSGLHALIMYRAAHAVNKKGYHSLARLISQSARFFTGIEIHPAAEIGRGLFIDHGSGTVIGETTVIGDNCTIYQGVTLGGTGKESGKRHPTLGDNVMVGAGAKLLGSFTVGSNSKIAAGAVVLSDVPENCTAVGIPAKVAVREGVRVDDCSNLDQVHVPDITGEAIEALRERVEEIEEFRVERAEEIEELRERAEMIEELRERISELEEKIMNS